MKTTKHRWTSPHAWLFSAALDWDGHELYGALIDLAAKVDADTLQDLFEADMDADGYFEELKDEDT